jgi:hypothetical protein
MLTAFRQTVTVPADGGIEIRSPALKPGTKAEVIVLVEYPLPNQRSSHPKKMTANALLTSGLVGLWADRQDLGDSQEFARQLRQNAEHREMGA